MTKYNKEPEVAIVGMDGEAWSGYEAIASQLMTKLYGQGKCVLTIDCYPGVRIDEVVKGLQRYVSFSDIIYSEVAALDEAEREQKLERYLTDDRVFGYMAPFHVAEFYCSNKLGELKQRIQEVRTGIVLVIGTGASLAAQGDVLVYADLARWEIQQRYRSGEFGNWMCDNYGEDILRKYKRAFFAEWRMADRLKRSLLPACHYYLDTNRKDCPVMVTSNALFAGLAQTASQPFRLVPYFDPGVWGGTWLESNIGLENKGNPYAWGFDGVPEENSLYFKYGSVRLELPSINLVFFQSEELLGAQVYARFGAEFPIRFDFLDTMGGQNLSLQVHPLTDYIKEHFGMAYTQDESYYMLETDADAIVYLGLKSGINREEMLQDLARAQQGGFSFPAEQYVNIYPAAKHDHFLIPAGTVHCSGINGMVLEISATPYIFTFKLWDWDRLGLDGKPRPVHLAHGEKNIRWERDKEWVDQNLVGQVEEVASGAGWKEERTGLHALEFIETRRHWFTDTVPHHTEGKFHMLNLVEGEEAIVESPTGQFEPFLVRYAETFIIPAAVGAYTISPTEQSKGKTLGTIKAYVRT
jgi:mannose-6-phosphate isomerase class I